MRTWRITLWLWLWAGAAGAATTAAPAARPCPATLAVLLDDVVVRAFDDPKYFRCSECFFNAGELADRVKQMLGKHFEDDKLRLLVVRHPAVVTLVDQDKNPWPSMLLSWQTRTAQNELWKFHVVVEYDGRILDLDLKTKQSLPVDEWFRTVLPPSEAGSLEHEDGRRIECPRFNDELVVHAVPWTEYRRRYPTRPPVVDDEDIDFLLSYPVIAVPR